MLPVDQTAQSERPVRIWPWMMIAGLCLIAAMIIMDEFRPLRRVVELRSIWPAVHWVVLGGLWNGWLIILAPLITFGLGAHLPPRSRRGWLGLLASFVASLLLSLPSLLRLASPLLSLTPMSVGWPVPLDPLADLLGHPTQVGRLLNAVVPAWLEMGPLIGVAATTLIYRWSTINSHASRGLLSLTGIIGLSATLDPWWESAFIIAPYQAVGAAWLSLGAVVLAHAVRTADWRWHIVSGVFALALVESRHLWDIHSDWPQQSTSEFLVRLTYVALTCATGMAVGWYLAHRAQRSSHGTPQRIHVWMIAAGYQLVAFGLYSLPSDDSTPSAFLITAVLLIMISGQVALVQWLRRPDQLRFMARLRAVWSRSPR